MVSRRLSREEGHRRKFLVVVDDTPECKLAVAYAARRAHSTNAIIVLLYVIDSAEFQHFLGVGKVMLEEATASATAALHKHASVIRETLGIEAELVIREGDERDELLGLIEDDQDIAVLVLAAGTGKEGPGPLVTSAIAKGSPFPIPVTIVPPNMSDIDIEDVA